MSSVMLALAWPSMRWTAFTFAPAEIASEAAVCGDGRELRRARVTVGGLGGLLGADLGRALHDALDGWGERSVSPVRRP
ncbi:hypothetical protein [Gordonia sp. NPDC003376]